MWNKGCAILRRCSAAAIAVLCLTPSVAAADVVLQWNEIAVRTLTTQTPALTPFAQARFAAIVQLAVFDAVNATTREYKGYLGSPVAPTAAPILAPLGSSGEAAAIVAAHDVLVKYFPGNATTLDGERDTSLAAIPDGAAKTNGIATGAAAAAAMIAERVGDGSSPVAFYLPPSAPAPGEWDITPGCPTDSSGNPLGGILHNWPDLRPFGVVVPAAGHWSDDFRPLPPPALTSGRYARDYNEVKRVGSATSTERPAGRATVVRFYAAGSPTFVFHTVARQLAEGRPRPNSLTGNARILALLSIATNDSLVASFTVKYHDLFWRPVTAIRAGDADGNRRTEPDPTFTPFITTPCFPSYPSNHASGSNAALEVLRRFYGSQGHDIALSLTIPVEGLVTLKYTSLPQISHDIDDARIYGGIHFRFDQEAGVRLGRRVGVFVTKQNLRRDDSD